MIAIMSVSIFDLLSAFDGPVRDYAAGQFLFRQGDPIKQMFLVQSGEVRLSRFLENGNMIILQRATALTVLAEASLFSPAYHCDGLCHQPAVVKAIAKRDVEARLQQDPSMSIALCAHLAHETQRARMKSEVIRLRTVSERLDAWLAWHDNRLPDKGNWHVIANEVGVSPEALYRELAKRRRE
jgi:CRP-like cAMP-binding protein